MQFLRTMINLIRESSFLQFIFFYPLLLLLFLLFLIYALSFFLFLFLCLSARIHHPWLSYQIFWKKKNPTKIVFYLLKYSPKITLKFFFRCTHILKLQYCLFLSLFISVMYLLFFIAPMSFILIVKVSIMCIFFN